MLAARQSDQGGNDGDDVLDAVTELVAQNLARRLGLFQLVDVGAGAEPAHDPAIGVPYRQGAAQGPAVDAIGAAQPVLDLVGFAGLQAAAPLVPGLLLVLG